MTHDRSNAAAAAMADAALWHAAASVVLPGVIINRSVWATRTILHKAAAPPAMVGSLPTAVGLLMIPLIVHHIDDAVTCAMAKK